MKRIFLLFLLLPLMAISQDKIEGIYKFKPGVTTLAIIPELEDELNMKVSAISNPMKFHEKTGYNYKAGKLIPKPAFLELINVNTLPDTKKYESFIVLRSPADSNHRVFYISSLSVAGIAIEKVYLFFRNGVLVQMSCDKTDELMKAMEAKYGEGETEAKETPVKCQYKLTGASFDEKEISLTTKWQNGLVLASSISLIYFDTQCKKQFVSTFSIERADLYDFYTKEEMERGKSIRAALEEKSKSDLKKQLAEF